MPDELVIKNGTVVDGAGGEPVRADVAIRDGKITEIGTFPIPPGVPTLDATGLVVAPGFIDIHSHSDFSLFVDPRAVSAVTQGVTLEVVGNCGHGCAPVVDPHAVRHNIYGYEEGVGIPWRTVRGYLDALEQRRPGVNVITLVPNGNLRLAAVGQVDRAATAGETARMVALLEEGMDEGAWGYSTGLEYSIESSASQDEVVALCKAAVKRGGFYATHTRNRMHEAKETIEEAIATAQASDAPLQISHISSVSRLEEKHRWAVKQAIEQVDRARRSGLDVTYDMHTRLFGMTNLSNVLPPWAMEGTDDDVIARLESKATRDKMRGHYSIVKALARDVWSRMVLYNCAARPELSRRSIADISKEWGQDPLDTIYDILIAERDNLHSVLVLGYVYHPDDIFHAYDHPCCMVGSDGTAMAPHAGLKGGMMHGTFTWAAWFFRYFVREAKRLSVQEAVRRLTSLPAQRLALKDRGVLRAGAWADIAVFDPQTFTERGTDFEPDVVATGMKHVLTNGRFALRDGELTGERHGRVLRR